jgi:hypothetical protein
MKAIRACINKLINIAKNLEKRLLSKSDPAKLLGIMEGIFHRLLYPTPENRSSLNRTPEPEKTGPGITRIPKKPVRVGEIIASTSPGLRKNIESLERPIERVMDAGKVTDEFLEGLIPEEIKPEPWHTRLKKTLDLFNLSHWNRRRTFIIATTLVLLNLMGSSFVVGLILSKESISSSGLIIKPAPYSPPPQTPSYSNPPPEPKIDLDVYSEIECINKKTEIEWGSINAGSSASRTIYIKNTGSVEVVLSFMTDKWNPEETSRYLTLSWDYDGSPVKIGKVVRIKLTLAVDSSINGVDRFNFDVIFIATSS